MLIIKISIPKLFADVVVFLISLVAGSLAFDMEKKKKKSVTFSTGPNTEESVFTAIAVNYHCLKICENYADNTLRYALQLVHFTIT